MNISQAIANKFGVVYNWREEQEWHTIKCPFHQDDSASAGLNFHSKMFNCFSPDCGSMPFWKLAKQLELEYDGIDYQDFQEWFDNHIEGNAKSRPIVLRKQVEAYTNFLLERKLKPETIEELGGYYVSDESHQDYGHLVFDYGVDKYGKSKSVKRRIIGTGDRFRQSNNTGDGDTKSLFGKCYNSQSTIILVEGVTDYCTLWQESYHNITASFGAKISKQQAYLLRNKIVFILFDRDYEGYSGALRAAEILKEYNCTTIILEIPENFGNGQTKVDVNSAYCFDADRFLDWLHKSIQKYNTYDTEYMTSRFLSNNNGIFKQVSTGLTAFDKLLNGGFATGIHGIAGPTSSGKSSLVTVFEHRFTDQDFDVLSISYEISKEQKYSRLGSRFDLSHSWAEIEKDHSILSMQAQNNLMELSGKLRIENDWTIDEIIAASKNFDVIIVDYIQRMPFEGSDEMQGIKNNFYKLNNLAINGKIVIVMSSMPEAGTTIFKGTNVLKYGFASGWILSRVRDNICSLECVKNTRGNANITNYIEIKYANQRAMDSVPPELNSFIKE